MPHTVPEMLMECTKTWFPLTAVRVQGPRPGNIPILPRLPAAYTQLGEPYLLLHTTLFPWLP